MGVILDKPVVDKEVTLFSQSEHKGAVVSMQGYRVSMEVDLSLQSVYAIGRFYTRFRSSADHFRLFLEKQAEEAGLDAVWLCSLLNR